MLLTVENGIVNPNGWCDNFCNECILFMNDFAEFFGLSYSEANILLFCVIQPLLIMYFMALALANHYKHSNKMKKITWVSIAVSIITPIIIFVLVVIFINIKSISPVDGWISH